MLPQTRPWLRPASPPQPRASPPQWSQALYPRAFERPSTVKNGHVGRADQLSVEVAVVHQIQNQIGISKVISATFGARHIRWELRRDQVRINERNMGAELLELLHDRARGRLAGVAGVCLVGEPEDENS